MARPVRRQHGEGSLYRRKSRNQWQWIAVAELGQRYGKRDRREFTGASPAEALAKREAFMDRRRDGFVMPKGRPPYVAEWMLHWLHNVAKREVAVTTWEKSYRRAVTGLICPWFERVVLSELSEEDIEEWHRHLEATVSKRTGKPLSPSTIGQAHRIMSRALKVAVKRGKLPRNPCSNVSPPHAPVPDLPLPAAAEVAAILARCSSWPGGARWVLAITTGLRQGEALELRWRRDVRLEQPASVSVCMAAAWIGGQRITKPPKSRSSQRTVPLAPAAVAALREHRRAQVASIDDLVFTDDRGGPVKQRDDWQDWKNLLADLGLPSYRVHDIRHAYATMLLEQGVDPRVVQAMLGHSTGALLARYQHVRPIMHEAVADAVTRALGG